MFDFTKEIQLSPTSKRKYGIAKAGLYFVFMLAVIYVSYAILFPITRLNFFFKSPTSSKNNLTAPRLEQTGAELENGKISANSKLITNANPLGQFSTASFSFTLDDNKSDISNASVLIKKSYQAFRYRDGAPKGFKNGTALFTPNGSYYIVSDEKLRKFANTDIILQLGYPKNSFMEVSDNDLAYNEIGDEINDQNTYPNDTLFAIGDTYYQLKNGTLFPFISARAFLSQFDAIQAIAKDADFLAKHQVSETPLGFADGTLASSDVSVYILSEGKSYPIMNPETFIAMGFNWDDIIPVTQDELNAHEKQKQFTYRQPHPNGTLFVDKKAGKYFVIENNSKRPILSDAIIKTLSKQKPIIIDIDGAEISDSCTLKKEPFNANTFQCNASLENLASLVGGDYQITTTFPTKANLDTLNITFSTPVNFQNMKISLGAIKNKILTKWQR